MKVTTILKWYSFVSENRQKESQEQERERDEKKAQAGERETTEQPFAQEIGKIKFRERKFTRRRRRTEYCIYLFWKVFFNRRIPLTASSLLLLLKKAFV